jgi:hypothetical protein
VLPIISRSPFVISLNDPKLLIPFPYIRSWLCDFSTPLTRYPSSNLHVVDLLHVRALNFINQRASLLHPKEREVNI